MEFPRELLFRPPVILLIAVNCIPLVGVLFGELSLFVLLLMYWAESAVIGFFNILKLMRVEPPDEEGSSPYSQVKWLLILFFIFHYGMFMFVHLVFIMFLFGFQFFSRNPVASSFAFGFQFLVFVAGLVVSHGISYQKNFIENKEYLSASLGKLMFQPYGRVVLMHFAILGLSFLLFPSFLFGVSQPAETGLLVLLILAKTGLDLFLHLRLHNFYRQLENAG